MAFEIMKYGHYVCLDYFGVKYKCADYGWHVHVGTKFSGLSIAHSIVDRIPEILLLTYPKLARKY